MCVAAACDRRTDIASEDVNAPRRFLRATPLALALRHRPAARLTPPTPRPTRSDKAAPTWTRSRCTARRMDKPSSVKYTEPLLDTPQTITVVTKEVMEEQNLLGLRDVLTTLPGITFGAGEGGGGYGDSINLRGFNANSDITTDGMRDSAQYTPHRHRSTWKRSNWSTARTRCIPAPARSAATSTW